MMKWSFICLAFVLSSPAAFAQSYFQQHVDTRIDVRLDDQKHVLHGFEEFVYTNHSPDTLRYIYVHLWPNAYLHDRTQFTEQQLTNRKSAFYYSKPADRGFIDSLNPFIDGHQVSLFSLDHTPDIARVDLPAPLPPGGSFTFTTPFRVKIPKVFSRLGHSKQAYYISQWFPKPAVYDRTGWHPMPYTDQGEFYSEIGNYKVRITLPRNYVVMATGNCTTESENAWLDSLAAVSAAHVPKMRTLSAHARDSINRIPKSDPELKTLEFEEDNIHDFAWFADKRFVVRKEIIPLKNREAPVIAYTACLPANSYNWRNSTAHVRQAVEQLSHEVGTYPYKTVKAVEGDMKAGGGMEYPTVTVVDRSMSGTLLKEVIVHEVGHNWFYGMLATNERDMPWMDEGINTFYEHKIMNKGADSSSLTLKKLTNLTDELTYYQGAASGTDQPANLRAADYTDYNYGADVYQKTGMLMAWLEGYMGKEAFRDAMHEYFDTWHFKHPAPADFEAIMRRHTDKSLDWFFKDAMSDRKPIDFGIRKVQTSADGQTRIRLVNRSGYEAPVHILAYRSDSVVADVWTEPFLGRKTITLEDHDADKWMTGDEMPDLRLVNNRYTRAGLSHGRGLRLRFGYGLGRKYHRQVYVLPAIGFNVYNGFMGGLLLHNLSVPDKNFRFAVAPMYGFNSKDFAFAGSAGYFQHPHSGLFREIVYQVDAKRFGYDSTAYNAPKKLYANYVKVAPSVTFFFRNKTAISPVTRSLTIKGYGINEQYFDYTKTPPDSVSRPAVTGQMKYYGLVRYVHQNNRLINPFSYQAEAQLGEDFAKLTIEGHLRIDYNTKGKSLYLRAFAGKFIGINNNPFATDRYWLNTTYNGANDYLYDETYLGRSERDGLAYRQVSVKEGGFTLPTSYYSTQVGRSDDWLASLNIMSDLPLGKLPIRLFLDVATFSDAKNVNTSGNAFLYEGGAQLHFFNDLLLIHVPLVYASEYKDYLQSIYGNKRFKNSITFTLNLQGNNWLRLSNSLSK